MMLSFKPLALDAVEFLSERTDINYGFVDFTDPRWLCVTARHDDGEIAGVVACEFKEWFDAHFSCAVDDRRCLSRRVLRAIFRALFSRAVRVTALISPDNELAISGARRMGFVYEGFLRMGVEGKRDALIFGMLADDCRYLPGFNPARTTISPISGGYHGLAA